MYEFQGISKLYGDQGLKKLQNSHVTIIGTGGVGSWSAEILARSGVGKLTLIDLDDICISNANRQVHTLLSTVGKSKVVTLKERIKSISENVLVTTIEEFITKDNLAELLTQDSIILDAIDSLAAKTALIQYCYRNKIPLVTTGAAGGKTDPSKIKITDLADTQNDMLLRKVRRKLRKDYQIDNEGGKFHITSVWSIERIHKPENCDLKSGRLDCQNSLGSAGFVTGAIGFAAASAVVNFIVDHESAHQ